MRKAIWFLKEIVAAHCLVEMVGERKMEVQVPVSMNLLIVYCSTFHSLHCLVGGGEGRWFYEQLLLVSYLLDLMKEKQQSHIKMPRR